MDDSETRTSRDRAMRPSMAMPRGLVLSSDEGRDPAEQAEIDRRVAIYTRQVAQTGRITWLPHRGEGHSA